MNATEEDFDSKLQKVSVDLIKDLNDALFKFMRKPDGQGGTRVRSWVRANDVFPATCQVLDMFQELPQLLDPHLQRWISLLATSYLEYLLRGRRSKDPAAKSKLLVPIDHAICKILYTFCKVRGEKVIVRFLSVEVKYLEPLLSAVEEAETRSSESQNSLLWSWEQRYIILLWLSHLLLAPFDLSTISSVEFEESKAAEVRNLELSETLPGLTKRIIPLAIKYLASPGKERDAAKALLVRIAMRRDMQDLGVLRSLVRWSLASLVPNHSGEIGTPHVYLGVLSFLAGILRSSSETSDMDEFLSPIFNTVHAITLGGNDLVKMINSFAVARKMILKVLQSVVVISLRQPVQTTQNTDMTENAIGTLLESLSDNDTPVRMAASKSLSVITLKLDPEMASQVVEAVLESLNRNVLWNKTEIQAGAKPIRDLSAVDNLEWHGLMLTLSHLLYRRSPPARQLSDIIHALILGLSFDQRSSSGTNVGANVRDASCFGIWALARRYSTEELLAVPTNSVFAAKSHPATSSIIQVLATELVLSATLDPFGNIRRGSSAALQELIGRHPDTVVNGIYVVQTVDYHAIARRSKAIGEVAVNVSKLSSQYGEAALDGILGWRGIGDTDAGSRRDSGAAFGIITMELTKLSTTDNGNEFQASFGLLKTRLSGLAKRQVEERHGLLLCMSALLDRFVNLDQEKINRDLVLAMMETVIDILVDCKETVYRRPELVMEAASMLATSSLPLIQRLLSSSSTSTTPLNLFSGYDAFSPNGHYIYMSLAIDGHESKKPDSTAVVHRFTAVLGEIITGWLDTAEEDIIEPVTKAALLLLLLSPDAIREKQLLTWARLVQEKSGGHSPLKGHAYFYVIAMAQPLITADVKDGAISVHDAIIRRWEIEKITHIRIAILQSLIYARLLQKTPTEYLGLLADGLNDYTTTAQGDIGSQVRVQAIKAVQILWHDLDQGIDTDDAWLQLSVAKLFGFILRLSTEKLDRVRLDAQLAVGMLMIPSAKAEFFSLSFSSEKYFDRLLHLGTNESLEPRISKTATANPMAWTSQLLAGYVTSADTGNEDLVIRSRAALTKFCAESSENLSNICNSILQNMKIYQTEDRVLVPTLEITAFLFNMGLFQRCADFNFRALCLQAQKAAYKTGNVRKIQAAVKVYGAIANADKIILGRGDGAAAITEAKKRLGVLLGHPWPKVRTAVIDELWVIYGTEAKVLTGVDWSIAPKAQIGSLVAELQLS